MRPREFSLTGARQKALDVFWSKGYEATSVDDLCCAMGISKSSFYQAFGCKHDLLKTVLDDYTENAQAVLARIFTEYRPVQAAVRAILESAVMLAIVGDDRRGCLIGNMAAELAPQSPENALTVRTKFEVLQGVFANGLADAKARGELSESADPADLAWYLMSVLMGLKLLAKANPDRATLQPVVDRTIAALE